MYVCSILVMTYGGSYMRRLIIFISALILEGCTFPTELGYRQRLSPFIGSPQEDLIAYWGVPHRSYDVGEKRFLTYENRRNVSWPGTQPHYTTTYIGNMAYTNAVGGSGPFNIEHECETTFLVVKGVITSFTFKGNDCTAHERE